MTVKRLFHKPFFLDARKGRRLLRSPDSVGLLHMAWNLLKTLGIDFPESCTKGTYEFLYTLAWKIGRGCGKEEYKAFGKYLVSVGKSQGGVDEGIFSEVANGFKLRSVDGRQNCMKIYQELASCDGGSEAGWHVFFFFSDFFFSMFSPSLYSCASLVGLEKGG